MSEASPFSWTDADAIEASRTDPDEFRTVFLRHYDALFRYLAMRAGTDTASEIASETFVQAFQTRRAFRTEYSSARPWLFGIANNLLKSHLRSRSARKRLARPLFVHHANHAEDIAWKADAQVAVRKSGLVDAINSLRWEDREILLLYAFADLTYREISEACDIPIGTVRSRLSRMRARLFPVLLKTEPDDDL